MLDSVVLNAARDNTGTHPDLVVRVTGPCAHFDDLPDSAEDEVTERTVLTTT